MNADYTDAERETIRKMRQAGYDNRAIARRIDRTAHSVSAEAARMGLDMRRKRASEK